MKRITCILLLCVLFITVIAGIPGDSARSEEKSDNRFSALDSLIESCRNHPESDRKMTYYVPGAWTVDPRKGRAQLSRMAASGELIRPVRLEEPYEFIGSTLTSIKEFGNENPSPQEQMDIKTGKGIIAVNFLPRLLSMYDHNGDGYIGSTDRGLEKKKEKGDITLNARGFREAGTFVKNILVLPYLKAMGYNTVHLQPITEIGVYGRKGDLGSPFAIRDPFSIDPSLSDPLFPQNVEEQYLAFIQAAHALGMKVVQEVIPRTVSIDSRILEKNPEYGYWVKEGSEKRMPDYYSPDYSYPTKDGMRTFADRTTFEKWFYDEYKKKIYSGKYTFADLVDITRTDPEYTGFFLPAPDLVKREPNGRLTGYYFKKDQEGKKIEGSIDETIRSEVLPAFCDTPFEIQPFWEDVTYLRLYADTDGTMPVLNPLSFVTAKFFKDVEPDIEVKYRYKPVWNMITHYFSKFKRLGVDGFVLDMGHALPEDLKSEIRNVLPAVWEENLGADFPYLATTSVVITGNVFAHGQPAYNDKIELKRYEENPWKTVTFHQKKMREMFLKASKYNTYRGKMFGFPDNYNTKRIGQSPATRDLSRAPLRKGTDIPDFTRAPVDQKKARKITLLYYTLFRILAEKEGTPFIVNPVFGTEFIATSTINVGLNTPMAEAKQFYEYMTPEERAQNPDAPRLLLMSKPARLSGEWTNEKNIVKEILEVNGVVERLRPLMKKNVHLTLVSSAPKEVLFLSLSPSSGKGKRLALVSNLDLDREHSVELPGEITHFYLNRPPQNSESRDKGILVIPPGEITVFEY